MLTQLRCNKCELHKTCKNIKIDGRGSQSPKYMFVGQAPGIEENELNKVFVGPAGQLLMQAIKKFDLKPAYITNLVKCFPPNDREPKIEEINKCKPYLMEEINKLKPEIIVTLGNIPLRALTGKNGVSKYSGRFVGEFNNIKIFSLYHPSYILRYPRDQFKWEMHLRELSNIDKNYNSDKIKVKIMTAKESINIINATDDIITFDFETNGKFKPYNGKIRCIGFNTNDENFVVNSNDSFFPLLMETFIKNDKVNKCAYNSVFENRWCLDAFAKEPKRLTIDPMLMHSLYNENASHDLESVASELLEAKSWDIYPNMIENNWTYETAPIEKVMHYCGLDVYWTRRISKVLWDLLNVDQKKLYFNILLPLAKVCSRLEYRGIKIDKKWANSMSDKYNKINSELIGNILELKEIKGYLMNKFNKEWKEKFNLGSYIQLSEIVFNIYKLKTNMKTENGKMSVKESALRFMKNKNKFIDLYLKWKKNETLRNNFLDKFPTYCDENDIIHPSYNPGIVVTGRLSVTNPPAQAIPEEKDVRGIVISRFKNGKLLYADFKALEMRLVASESNETRLIDVLNNDGDPHKITAIDIFGENFGSKQRSIAKRINFGMVYGISNYTMSQEFDVSKQEATNWLDKYNNSNQNIDKWMKKQHEFIKKNKFIKSKFGRIRHIPEVEYVDGWKLERILRQAGNFPIQSAGADITNLCSIWIDKKLMMNNLKSVLFNQIHDAVHIDIFPGEESKVLNIVTNVMTKDIQSFCKWMDVKLSIDYKLEERWDN